jgi:hypothetical protein
MMTNTLAIWSTKSDISIKTPYCDYKDTIEKFFPSKFLCELFKNVTFVLYYHS